MTVTGTDFRANQSRYIGIARSGEDVILRSRAGSVMPRAEHARGD